MKGEFAIIVAFATVVTAYWPGDKPILPVPTVCPDEDPIDKTIHLAHDDCEKFYKCVGGEKIEMLCPWMDKEHTRRLHFNKILQICDYPFRAGCKQNHIPTTPLPTTHLTPPPPPPTNCLNAPAGTTFPHSRRCYKYYYCLGNGKSETRDCDDGMTYNPATRRCDNIGLCAINGPCRNIKVAKGDFVYIADPESCKNAYVCGEENDMKLPCEGNSEWSKEQSKCLPADQANCRLY